MTTSDVIVIGGGQAGLAMSRHLSERGVSHVVLERGRVGQAWRDRWDSLCLLTPNWQTRLPGFSYRGPRPNGYMGKAEFVGLLEGYAAECSLPVLEGVTVLGVTRGRAGCFCVSSSRGDFLGRNLVIATGHCMRPSLPKWAERLAPRLAQLTTEDYKSSASLPSGGVLVVGASAAGVQLAHEIQSAGHQVTLAVGRHRRMLRRYRGRDIMYWLDRSGILHESADQVSDLLASRRSVSLQLVGSDDDRALDLGTLARAGVQLTGRALSGEGNSVALARDLTETTHDSELKLTRLLGRIDSFIDGDLPLATRVKPEARPPIVAPASPLELDLARLGINSVVWPTGYKRSYPWLELPVLGPDGEIVQRSGVTAVPGVYVLGLNFQRRRSSSYIDGVGDDARVLCEPILRRLERLRTVA